ncbi:MAG: hypothetical protein V2I51_22850, partial [Anderseniella sp.]|nr:hypothetical protein [Anderseniella sp.]
MEISPELIQLAFVVFAALAVGGLVVGVLFPYFTGEAEARSRARKVASGTLSSGKGKAAASKDKSQQRSRRIQETLKEFEEAEKKRRKKLTVRQMIHQAGLELNMNAFVMASL